MMLQVWNIINTKIGVAVMTAVITASLNLIYNKWHIKKEQKVRFENVTGDRTAEALCAVRDIELKARNKEVYDIKNRMNEPNLDMFSPGRIYPEIMNSPNDFTNFFECVSEARGEYERYLDYKTAAFLYYMENYCLTLMKYMADHQPLEFPLAGTAFIFDLQKWQKAYEKEIVKRINRPKYHVCAKDGWRWEYEKKKIMNKFWKRSILYGLIYDIDNPELRMIKGMFYGTDDMDKLI